MKNKKLKVRQFKKIGKIKIIKMIDIQSSKKNKIP